MSFKGHVLVIANSPANVSLTVLEFVCIYGIVDSYCNALSEIPMRNDVFRFGSRNTLNSISTQTIIGVLELSTRHLVTGCKQY